MEVIPVIVQHSGRKYDLELDPSANGETFKYQVFSVTGVEPDRQKILVKGGQLRDDQDMSKLGIKAKHLFRLLGTPSGQANVIEKPKDPIKFVEDMTEAEAAQSEGATPAGLQNLGNTCYLNSTLQTLRFIPELQDELLGYKSNDSASGGIGNLGDLAQVGLGALGSSTDLTESLRDLYTQMSKTQGYVPPLMFLNTFRSAYPQFAELSRDGRGYAQQDAEEAWSQIISVLRRKLRANARSSSHEENISTSNSSKSHSFIDEMMGGRFEVTEECLDPAAKEKGETETRKPDEYFHKIGCHISDPEVRHLSEGIKAGLTSTYDKLSPTLERDAQYITRSKIARLPKYLPIHLMRFYWKRDINKKAKVLKRVTFQAEMDLSEYCTDELREQLIPVRDKMRDLRKEELDVERARKRQKMMENAISTDVTNDGAAKGLPTNQASVTEKGTDKAPVLASNGEDAQMSDADEYKTDTQIEAERAEQILKAKRDLLAAVSPDLAKDETANQTGLYELRAVITHQGASADSGHYTAYVKKEGKKIPQTGKREPEDGNWWWFNDDKVNEVSSEKIETLAGGGEAHSALILLYRAVELPVLDSPLEDID